MLTFRNIHNWIKDGQIDANLRTFYAALKPGGILGVEEHRAAPGTSLPQTIETGYVTEAYVIEHARAAGFDLLGESEVNSNPRDTKKPSERRLVAAAHVQRRQGRSSEICGNRRIGSHDAAVRETGPLIEDGP